MTGWQIVLADPRSDSRTEETHAATADKLRMDRRGTIEETLAAYVRGEDGRTPADQGYVIDPVLAAIAAHHGIVPLRLLRTNNLGLGFGATLEHGDPVEDITRIQDDYAPELTGVTYLARGVTYSNYHVIQPTLTLCRDEVGAIPEALRCAIVGRPLSALMLIPGLEGDGPVIMEVGEQPGHDRLTLGRLPSIPCER